MVRTQFLVLLIGILCVHESEANFGLFKKEQPPPLPPYLDKSCKQWAENIMAHYNEARQMVGVIEYRINNHLSSALKQAFPNIFSTSDSRHNIGSEYYIYPCYISWLLARSLLTVVMKTYRILRKRSQAHFQSAR